VTVPWTGVIPESELQAYRSTGWGKPVGLGARPALLIIDVQYRTTGTVPRPFAEAIEEFPTACGDIAWQAVAKIRPLLAFFRKSGFPVLFPHVAPKLAYDGGRFAAKMPSVMTVPAHGYDFVSEVAPLQNDILIAKRHPSAFFGTALPSYLVDLGVDSLVITGCTTSGCIRSSVVDAFSYNYKVAVPQDCVYDRSSVTHAVNLFDMAQKYADVMPSEQLLELLTARHAGSTNKDLGNAL